MVVRVCLLLEALSVVICLHHLYGEKFRLDIKTVGFLGIDMIIMTAINEFGWPRMSTMIIYPIIFVYCGLKFGLEVKKLIVNNILCIIIVGLIQIVTSLICHYIFGVNLINEMNFLIVNCMALGQIILIYLVGSHKNVVSYMQYRGKIITVALLIIVLMVLFGLVNFKGTYKLGAYQYIILFMLLGFICVLATQIGKYKIRAKEIETELRMHKLYADSFKTLIEEVRIRQHEFDNHISTIYSQHLLCDTYEGLVEMQKDYCQALEKDNRYNKLLKSDNHVIRGFLYVKFLEIEKLGIEVTYEIVVDKLDIKMPIYKIVEVLGDLINNAVEAMMEREDEKRLHISIIEIEKQIEIEVRNTSQFIPRRDISKFFDKGYSKKGDNRGLGLYNVKKICNEYEFEVSCDNKVIEDKNWLGFTITNKHN